MDRLPEKISKVYSSENILPPISLVLCSQIIFYLFMFLVLDIKAREGLMRDRYAFVIDLKPSVQKLYDVQCTEIV